MSRTAWLVTILSIAVIGIIATTRYSHDVTKENESVQSASVPEPKNDLLFHKWHEFVAPGRFKVLLPSLPQHATERQEDPKTKSTKLYDMYVSQQGNGTLYMINQISMMDKHDRKLDETTLTNVINDVVAANPDSKINLMQMGKYHEHPAIDFAIENTKVSIEGKAFLVGDVLYLLTTVSKPDDFKKEEFVFFVNSFDLISDSSEKK